MLLIGSLSVDQLSVKGFGTHGNGKHHPVHEKKGVTEDQLKISVKGNNDTIEVNKNKTTKRKKLTNAESHIEYLKSFQNNIEFAVKTVNGHTYSFKGDVPLLALQYINTPSSNPEAKQLRSAGWHIANKEGKNWRLIKDGKILKQSDNLNEVYNEYEASTRRLVDSIKYGDKVTILTSNGQQISGKAVMKSSMGDNSWVINTGGPHGRPAIASEANVISVSG